MFLYAAVIDKYPWEPGCVRSVKPWLYLFSADDPHSLVVRGTHSQVRTVTAVVRPSPRSHAKLPTSAKVAIILKPLLTCIDTSVNKSIANDCVIPRHCKHFHSPIFSYRFIFSAGQLNLMGHGTKYISRQDTS